jgi:hypothetical protein
MQPFFYLVTKSNNSIMSTLSFDRRGPFRITGITFLTIYLNVSPYCYYWYLDDYDTPDSCLSGHSVPWIYYSGNYRKTALADRGPFEFGGLVSFKGWSPVNIAYYSCSDCVEEAHERGPGDQLTGWYCAETPWIYYSGNISNEQRIALKDNGILKEYREGGGACH